MAKNRFGSAHWGVPMDNFSLFGFDFTRVPYFAYTVATFFGAAVALYAFQIMRSGSRIGIRQFLAHCFPASGWKTKSARIDILVYLASKLTSRPIAWVGGLITISMAAAVQMALETHLSIWPQVEAGFVEIALCSLVIFLAMDFANYLTHYVQHVYPLFWELHKVHHSATFLNPATTKRMHPLGDLIDAVVSAVMTALPMGLFAFHFGFTIIDLLAMYATANFLGTVLVLDTLRHSHFPISFGKLDALIISPHMHQLHHSSLEHHWDRNFGNKLSIWDWMFGTAYKPAKGEEIIYGLPQGAHEDYESIYGTYVGPLAKMGALCRRHGVLTALAAGLPFRFGREARAIVNAKPTVPAAPFAPPSAANDTGAANDADIGLTDRISEA